MKRSRPLLAAASLAVLSLASAGVVVPVAAGPERPALKAVKRDAFFTDLPAGNVYRVQIKFKKKPAVKVKKTFTKVKNPWGVAVDPAGKFILVTDNKTNELVKLQAKKGKVLARVAVGKGPTDVGIHPSGDYAYVVNNKDNSITVVDTRTDQVVDTFKLGKGPMRLDVSDSGSYAFVAATENNVMNTVDLAAAVSRVAAARAGVVETRAATSCDIAGGISSVRIDSGSGTPDFNYVNWACGASSIASIARHSSGRLLGGDGSESDESSYEDSSESRDGEPRQTGAAVTGTAPPHPLNGYRTPFGVPGRPAGLIPNGLTRSPAYLDFGFCSSSSLALGYGPPSTPDDISDDEAWFWRFGFTAVRIGDGSPFEPLIGGGGDQIWVHPVCGAGCNPAKVIAQTKQITVKGAAGIQDGAMNPVPFGGDC